MSKPQLLCQKHSVICSMKDWIGILFLEIKPVGEWSNTCVHKFKNYLWQATTCQAVNTTKPGLSCNSYFIVWKERQTTSKKYTI